MGLHDDNEKEKKNKINRIFNCKWSELSLNFDGIRLNDAATAAAAAAVAPYIHYTINRILYQSKFK